MSCAGYSIAWLPTYNLDIAKDLHNAHPLSSNVICAISLGKGPRAFWHFWSNISEVVTKVGPHSVSCSNGPLIAGLYCMPGMGGILSTSCCGILVTIGRFDQCAPLYAQQILGLRSTWRCLGLGSSRCSGSCYSGCIIRKAGDASKACTRKLLSGWAMRRIDVFARLALAPSFSDGPDADI